MNDKTSLLHHLHRHTPLIQAPMKLDRANGQFGLPSSDSFDSFSEIYSDVEEVRLGDVLAKLDQKAVDVSKVDLKTAQWSESSNAATVDSKKDGSLLKVMFSLGCLD